MSLGFGVLVRWKLPALLPSPKRWTSVCTPTPKSGNSPDQSHEQSPNERHHDVKEERVSPHMAEREYSGLRSGRIQGEERGP